MSLETINLQSDLHAAQKSGNLDEIIRIASELKEAEEKESALWRADNAKSIRTFISDINAAKTEMDWKEVMERGYQLFCFDAPVSCSIKTNRNKKSITDAQIISVFGANGHKYSRSEIAERLNINPERVQQLLKNLLGKEISKEGELKSTRYFLTP